MHSPLSSPSRGGHIATVVIEPTRKVEIPDAIRECEKANVGIGPAMHIRNFSHFGEVSQQRGKSVLRRKGALWKICIILRLNTLVSNGIVESIMEPNDKAIAGIACLKENGSISVDGGLLSGRLGLGSVSLHHGSLLGQAIFL